MEENEILKAAVQAAKEQPVDFEVDVRPKSRYHKWLQSKKLAPTKKVFTIRPLTLNQLEDISILLLDVNVQNLTVDDVLKLAATHSKTAAAIIARAVTETWQTPTKATINFFRHIDQGDLALILGIVLKQLQVSVFLTSIASMRLLNILERKEPASVKSANKSEANPQTPGVSIAHGIHQAA